MRVVIVGASLAGLRTAQALRALGSSAAITLIGDESEPPYDRPPLSKHFLLGQRDADQLRLNAGDGLDVEWRLGRRACALDRDAREIELEGGERIGFDRLVIATGSTPRRLGGPALGRISVLRTLADAAAIRDRLVAGARVAVIGGGFIGAEIASTARDRGLDVTLIEPEPVLMRRILGDRVGGMMTALHRTHGVDVRCGATAVDLDGGESAQRVRLSDGRSVEADVIVAGIGSVPATGWLEGSGLRIADGVLCDARLRALGTDHIFAAGDVARWHHPLYDESVRVEHWTNATEQAAIVAANICGDAREYRALPYVWTDQFGAKLQIVGRARAGDDIHVVEHDADTGRFVALAGAGGRLTAVMARGSLRPFLAWRGLLEQGVSWPEALDKAAA